MTAPRLSDLLSMRSLSGVRRWPAAPAGEVLTAAAEAAGWRVLELDSTGAATKAEFLQVCADAFALPEWFGMNWDALEECLTDLDPREVPATGGLLVAWSGWGDLATGEPDQFDTAVEVLRSAVARWRAAGTRGAVLLLGDGPEVDLAPVVVPPAGGPPAV